MARKKSASETAAAQSNEVEPVNATDISGADGAKILKDIDKLAKKYEEKSNRPYNFIEDVASAIGATERGTRSKYATIKAKNGRITTIRLSNHNTTVKQFDDHDEQDGISIVVSNDTGEKILVSKIGAEEVTSHNRYDDAHLKSISAIPRMLKNAVFLGEEQNSKGNGKFDSYRYYAVGIRIDGNDYTAKIVIGVKQGKKYYDHRLTEFEKSRLIDVVNQSASDFTTAGNASLPPYVGSKGSKLVSLLQTNPEEIARAEEKMRSVLDEMACRRGYTSSPCESRGLSLGKRKRNQKGRPTAKWMAKSRLKRGWMIG